MKPRTMRSSGGPWGFIALFVDLHRAHPDVPLFEDRQERSATWSRLSGHADVRCEAAA